MGFKKQAIVPLKMNIGDDNSAILVYDAA